MRRMGKGSQLVIVLSLFGACGGASHDAAPPAQPAPAAAQPAPPPAPDVMVKLRAFTDEMCACKDKACAERVQEATAAWEAEDAASTRTHPRPEPDEARRAQLQALGNQYGTCLWNAANAGAPPQMVAGLPADCRAYEKAIKDIMACDKIPAETREALRQSYDQVVASWAAVPPDAMPALAAACKAAADAVNQSAGVCN